MRRGSVRGESGAGPWCLPALILLLPFEPRHPTLPLLGLKITLLEATAAASGLWMFALDRAGWLAFLRRPALPWVLLASYAAAHVLSALLAAAHRDLAVKFALRMVVMAAFALVVAATPREAHRRGLLALAFVSCGVAILAVLEGLGARFLDPFLDLFREIPFNVGGSRRASAGSEYPNLAAAFLMYGLLAGVGIAAGARRPAGTALGLSALVSAGLLWTYSRGALVATALGLVGLALLFWRGERRLVRAPAAALVVLLASVAFAYRGEIFRLRLEREGTEAWYGAVYEPAETSLVLAPGEVRVTPVRVTNKGLRTWTVDEAFHLSYHWYDMERQFLEDGGRTVLPRDLAPGESVTLRAEVRAPGSEGRYLLVWDMVHEDTAWFSGQGVAPAAVPVEVSADSASAARPSPPKPEAPVPRLAWRPSRGELWSLAFRMWRERPWTGVGSDNFRWLHGPKAGQAFWDTRVFSNNTLLEAAATTGTPGLLALVGTLVSLLLTALRRARRAAPGSEERVRHGALFAVGVGLVAHGAVDYTLAFTGHYLLLGFLVGAVSARPAPPAEAVSPEARP